MVQYDPKIIQQAADGLYAQARSITLTALVAGAAIGALGGYAIGKEFGALVAGVVGAFAGVAIARQRAFVLQLQAQTALCQMEIERNTRGSAPRDGTDQRFDARA